jgi:hypothetical protein
MVDGMVQKSRMGWVMVQLVFQCATIFLRTDYIDYYKGLRAADQIKIIYVQQPVSKTVFESAPTNWLDQGVMGSMNTLEQLKKEYKGFQGKHQRCVLYD